MKKLLLIPILTLVYFAAFSQGEIKNASYFNVSWNKPIMNYGEQVEPIDRRSGSQNLYNWYRTDKEDFQHMGGAIEFGTNFYIHPTGVIKGFKAGVIVDFIDLGVNWMSFQDTTIKRQNPTDVIDVVAANDLTARYSLNIGVITTYSPVKNFYFDLYYKFRPTFAVNYFNVPMFEAIDPKTNTTYFSDRIYSNDESLIYENGVLVDFHKRSREDTGTGWGMNHSFGFNIRYAKVTLGMEWVIGKLKYKYSDLDMDQTVADQYFKAKIGLFFTDK